MDRLVFKLFAALHCKLCCEREPLTADARPNPGFGMQRGTNEWVHLLLP